eukprot:gnl/TRDRNA2_/TRDRNA2_177601_c0_seq3.p1 gnl/TRDRNA2_/TRDRNA2_177601_c0~~gnl/TRDRNA2_/TRDRNA2_177601_c0_seq3.p1  ORF type:complete len:437 (+),score=-32.72 gnl/TRDRNA2_/TRDRNA2_177601_c0_seq3:98-1408(+)
MKNSLPYHIDYPVESVCVQFISALDERPINPVLNIPIRTTRNQLNNSLNEMIKNEEKLIYWFTILGSPFLSESIADHLHIHPAPKNSILKIFYSRQSFISLNPIRSCSADLMGHNRPILTISFGPEGQKLCSGSGDKTLRFWNVINSMPEKTVKNYHRSWILSLSWSPDGVFVASGGLDNLIRLWIREQKNLAISLSGHEDWISSLDWKPCNLEYPCRYLLSGSKDGGVVKDVCFLDLKMEQSRFGLLILDSLFLFLMRIKIGLISLKKKFNPSQIQEKISQQYRKAIANHPVRLASGSDDYTIVLWNVNSCETPKAKLLGHQKPVNYLSFSPDTKWLISASFDHTIRLWCGITGRFLSLFGSHVGPVYMCAWSPSSRFFASASKDSTIKIFDVLECHLSDSLTGHKGHVFAIDWSPDGRLIASGGKDGFIKLWKN